MEAEVPFPDEGINGYSDAGSKEIGAGSNGSICSKSPEAAISFKVAESLVGKRSITEGSIANGITEGGKTEAAAEIAEYDVEGVLQKQETHDLVCPNCRACITKRVILRRRKRKAPEICTDEEGSSSTPGLTFPPAGDSVVEPSSSGCCFEAFTCFSCLHVIFPNGLWFPFGIFGPKPEDVNQLGNTAAEHPQEIDPPVGQSFCMRFLTCCQPSMDVPKKPDGSMIVPQQPQKPRGTRLPVIGPSHDDPLPGIDVEAQPILHTNEQPARRGVVSGYDIIKAIVYGGLLEIIASLSVVSSAAGGDATTLNIVAVGLANVFGGLVVLFHNLRILKNEHVISHYQEQLGRRNHFPVHATVAVISYLVFGMMPPLVYGFTFRESNDKNSKLIALAVASLVSITVLSIGKAYVRNPPKGYWETILYYFSSGFMVSGLGFVAGQLMNELLKKLGLFEPSSPVSTSMGAILGGGAMKEAWSWSSY